MKKPIDPEGYPRGLPQVEDPVAGVRLGIRDRDLVLQVIHRAAGEGQEEHSAHNGDRQAAVARTGDAVGRHERLISSNRRRRRAQEAHHRCGRSSVSEPTLAQVRGVTQVGAKLISGVSGGLPTTAAPGIAQDEITSGRTHRPRPLGAPPAGSAPGGADSPPA